MHFPLSKKQITQLRFIFNYLLNFLLFRLRSAEIVWHKPRDIRAIVACQGVRAQGAYTNRAGRVDPLVGDDQLGRQLLKKRPVLRLFQ